MSGRNSLSIKIISVTILFVFLLTQIVPANAAAFSCSHSSLRPVATDKSVDANSNGKADTVENIEREMTVESANSDNEQASPEQLYLHKLAEALSFQIKTQNLLYPKGHPAVVLLEETMRLVTDDPEIKVYLLASQEKNAFALPNKEIYVTRGMLEFIRTKEELAALLMHENTHIASQHSLDILKASIKYDIVEALGMHRLKELEADVSMMIALDKRGLNPYGAILLTKRFRKHAEDTRPSPVLRSRYEAEMHDIDWQHGTPMQREMNLRELVRFWDFRHLSTETHSINHKAVFPKAKVAAVPGEVDWTGLLNEEFWIMFGRMINIGSRTVKMQIIKRYLENQDLGLDEDEEACLIIALFRFIFKDKKPLRIVVNGKTRTIERDDYSLFRPDIVAKLFDKDIFSKTGIKLSPQYIFNLSMASAQQLIVDINEENLDERCSQLARLRKSTHSILQRHFGVEFDFVKSWDTQCLALYLEKMCVAGMAEFNISERRLGIIDERTNKEAAGHFFEFKGPVPVPFKKVSEKDVMRFFNNSGLELLDASAVFMHLVRKTGLMPLYQSIDDHMPVFDEKNAAIAQAYVADVAECISPVFKHVISSIERKKMRRLEKLYQSLEVSGNYFYDLVLFRMAKEKNEAAARPARPARPGIEGLETLEIDTGEELFSVPWSEIDDIAINVSLVKDILNKTASDIKQIKDMSSKDLDKAVNLWWHRARLDIGREDKLRGLFMLIDGCCDAEDSFLTNIDASPEYIRWRALTYLYGGSGKKSFLRDLNNLFGVVEQVKLNEASLFVEWLESVIRHKNQLGISPKWTFGRNELAELKGLLSRIKMDLLKTLADKEGSGVLSAASSLIEDWPNAWVILQEERKEDSYTYFTEETDEEVEDYQMYWNKISKSANTPLGKMANAAGAADFEKLLALSCFAQGSWSAMSVASICFREAILRSKDFEEAFGYMKKYSFLPPVIIQEGIDALVEQKASTPQDMKMLTGWVEENIGLMLESRENILLTELSQSIARLVPEHERLEFFTNLISTNESDRGLKEYLAPRWFRSMPHEVIDDLRNIAQKAFFGELHRDNRVYQAAVDIMHNLSLREIENYAAFEALYSTFFRLSGVVVYLLLRSMALEGTEALFRVSELRKKLLGHFFSHYVVADGNNNKTSQRLISNFIKAVCDVTRIDAEELFYFTGPSLAAVALQFPNEPYDNEKIIDLLLKGFLDDPKTQRDYSDPRNPERNIANADEFVQTRQLLRDRIKVAIMGTRPRGIGKDENSRYYMEFPPQAHYLNFEDACLRRLEEMGLQRRKKVFQDKVTPMQLSVEVGKNVGALGVRLLQLIGLYFDLSPEDRAAVMEVYDKVRGQTKLQAFTVMQREAEHSPVFKGLFDSITEMNEMIGGGSIVTVYEVVDTEGMRWAVGVKNPNAEFRTWELFQFANLTLDGMIEIEPKNDNLKLVKIFLKKALEWIEAEIRDPDYIEKTKRFYQLNDSRSRHPERFQQPRGHRWRIRVPFVKDTGTDWVRWEELISGIELAEFMKQAPQEKTDINARTISGTDARQAMSLIAKNYFHQLFVAGLAHSDIHPGNFILTEDKEVAILDRKNLFVLEDNEKEFLRKLLSLLTSGTLDEIIELLSSNWITDTKQRTVFVQSIKESLAGKFDPKNPEQSVAAILMSMEKEGIDIPLKWVLVLKSMLGLNKMCQWAGFNNLIGAFLYMPEGKKPAQAPATKIAELVYPEAGKVSFRVDMEEDALRKIMNIVLMLRGLLDKFELQLNEYADVDAVKQAVNRVAEVGEDGISRLKGRLTTLTLSEEEFHLYQMILDSARVLYVSEKPFSAAFVLARLPAVVNKFKFLKDSPAQREILVSLLNKVAGGVSTMPGQSPEPASTVIADARGFEHRFINDRVNEISHAALPKVRKDRFVYAIVIDDKDVEQRDYLVELFRYNGFKAKGIDNESQLEAVKDELGAEEDDIVVEIRRDEFEDAYELFLPGSLPIKMDSDVGDAIKEYFSSRETVVDV